MLSKNKRKFSRVENKDSKSICSAMETELSVWVNEVRELNACIDGDSIRAQAHEIYQSIYPEIPHESLLCLKASKPFKASRGWLSNFCKRKNFSYRRITTSGRVLPKDAFNRINDFYIEVIIYRYKYL